MAAVLWVATDTLFFKLLLFLVMVGFIGALIAIYELVLPRFNWFRRCMTWWYQRFPTANEIVRDRRTGRIGMVEKVERGEVLVVHYYDLPMQDGDVQQGVLKVWYPAGELDWMPWWSEV